MVQKRQLYEDEYDVSPKHLKLEHNCDLVPSLQFTKEDASPQSDKDAGCFFKPNYDVENGFVSGKFTDSSVCVTKDVDCALPGCLSASSWASSTVTEEDTLSEAVAPPMSDAYFYLLERSPMKQVSVGPGYQAEIPEWHGYEGDEIKFLGSSIIPMHENQTVHDGATVGSGRTECFCQNMGSTECVRQHIKESREVLKERVGLKAFLELGFGDMGEMVAEKWTEDDEQLFHDVVYSNPVSSGRNFWKHLAAEFPSRSSQEIVSYYFNVFMLRRRTEQNRADPMNADSDDDESQEYDSHYHHNGSQPGKLHNSCSFDSTSEKTIAGDSGDGSSTSSDTVGTPCTSKANKSWVNHEFTFEPLDPSMWDAGYFSSAGTKTEFLPTGSMIEEVFGIESWDFGTSDDDKRSN